MTRINLVPPSELSDRHLLAENYELPRVFSLARKAQLGGERPVHVGDRYVLGPGHLKFFRTRLAFLVRRFEEIQREMRSRGFVARQVLNLKDIDSEWFGEWTPSPEEVEISRMRLREKVKRWRSEEDLRRG